LIEKITSSFNDDPIFYGLVLILLAITSLALRIYLKKSFKIKDHNVMSWKAYINSWVFIFLLFVMGISLVLRNI